MRADAAARRLLDVLLGAQSRKSYVAFGTFAGLTQSPAGPAAWNPHHDKTAVNFLSAVHNRCSRQLPVIIRDHNIRVSH